MHQNVNLGSNGVDRVRSLRKIPTRLRGTNFCTSSARFAPGFLRLPNGPECTQIVQTHQNVSLGYNGVHRVRSLRKIPTRLRGTNFCTSSARFAPIFVREPNSPECTQIVRMHQNVSLGSNGLDRVPLLRKILKRLRGTNYCTSPARFAPTLVRQPDDPECTQIV
jgi:hypothetical protein